MNDEPLCSVGSQEDLIVIGDSKGQVHVWTRPKVESPARFRL